MRKVFILNDGGHNYSPAKEYGELVFLNIPYEVKWDISRIYATLKDGLRDADEDDLIVISNLTTFCCVATALMVEWYGRVNYLLYKKDKYIERNLVINPEVIQN